MPIADASPFIPLLSSGDGDDLDFILFNFIFIHRVHNKSFLRLFLAEILCLCLLCDDNFNLTDISNLIGSNIILCQSPSFISVTSHSRLRVRARVATNWRGSHRSRVTNLRPRRPRVPITGAATRPCVASEGGAGCFYLISDQF